LNGEKIDIVTWSADPRVHAINALAPAKVDFVEMVPFEADAREDRRLGEPSEPAARKYMIRAVVPRNGFTQAIGKRGQNVRLSSRLIGWKISIEQKEEKDLGDEVKKLTELLVSQLGVTFETAQTIFNSGYHSPEGITNDNAEEFASGSGIDPEEAERIWAKADAFVKSKNSMLPPTDYDALAEAEEERAGNEKLKIENSAEAEPGDTNINETN